MEKDIWTGGKSGRWTIGSEGESHNDFSFGAMWVFPETVSFLTHTLEIVI